MTGTGVLGGLDSLMIDVALALVPLLIFFLAFQFLYLKLPRSYVANLLKGVIFTYVGMVLFLQGVHVAFLPAGQEIGAFLASLEPRWILIPFGFLVGFLATYAEPAVRILCRQVEESSSGFIRESFLLVVLSGGVAGFVAFGMARLVYDIPFLHVMIIGYVCAICLLPIADRDFIAIAFDSGGVATGPMAVTFLMALSMGASEVIEGKDPVIDGFGLIAFIALAPIIAILLLGVVFRIKGVYTHDM
ncbi:MAG TPA: DUF1538 domain-containing protein [Methanoregulaceae archaeon]|jgi:hypothetical protein|nr:DUF1538 domain-containing protein [Methanolinea sp.]MDD3091149.1 DUF1538 domain-containing protein [Methanoregulaceae archaeon]MDD5047710.1 DUF1538 domain-containing protein [Methanoregulaceae archaeon]MDD5685168.1 DUF1538 domain-containing protein [Methanoregulaceae archaeon]HOP67169.1 DUF1538 domain-containing protein [Methanoregulaceae archaeon]